MHMTTIRIDTCPICNGKHLIHKLSQTDSISGKVFDILQCSDCGLHITQHAPRLQDMGEFYPDSESACYKPAQGVCNKWLEYLLGKWYKNLVKIVHKEADRYSGVLIELGCKEGYFANAIRNNGWIAHAVEHDPTAREYGNKRFMLQIEDAGRFFHINARSYNVAVAWDTLGEAIDIHRTIEKLSQIIVKDGTIIIAFHNAQSDDARRYGASWDGWNVPRKRWHLTPHAFETLIEKHNLEIVGKRHDNLRAFITALTSEWKQSRDKNIWKSTLHSLTNIIKTKSNHTYYIYTLKHKQ